MRSSFSSGGFTGSEGGGGLAYLCSRRSIFALRQEILDDVVVQSISATLVTHTMNAFTNNGLATGKRRQMLANTRETPLEISPQRSPPREPVLLTRGVHWNGSSRGNEIPMGFPRKWELDLNTDGNGNTTSWEWERLILVWSQNHSRGLVKSNYAAICALCLRLSHKGYDLFLSSVTRW